MAINFTCDCCDHTEPFTKELKIFSNKLLLGCDAELCWYCFAAWYDEDWQTNADIANISKRLRQEGRGIKE
jgi:hypothetical protein